LISVSAPAQAAQTILGANTAKADLLWRQAIAPLPSTNQRAGFKIGYFEQGIITGGLITLASVVATVSTLGYYTWNLVRARA
jgi:hypothetical protein